MKRKHLLALFATLLLGSQAYALDVSNFESGEVVQYPLVMLRGDTTGDDSVAINVVNRSSKMDSRSMNGLVSKGRFKLFAELVPGKNELKITHGGDHKLFRLTYKPQSNSYKVRAVFYTDNTGDTTYESQLDEPQDFHAKWDASLKLLQCFTADWMNKNGHGRRTFNLELDKNGKVIVHIIKSPKSFEELQKVNGGQAFQMAYADIMKQLPQDKKKYKNLVQIAWSRHDKETGHASGYAALGGGGVGLMGGACFYTWPSGVTNIVNTFTSEMQIDTKNFHADGGDAIFRTAGNTLGASLHELGHAFGLPHTSTKAGLGSAIMFHGYQMGRYVAFADPPWRGNGNKWVPYDEAKESKSIYLAPVSAAALAPTRFFAMTDREYTAKNSIQFGLDDTKKRVKISSADGLAFACIELPGNAEKYREFPVNGKKIKEVFISIDKVVKEFGTDNLTIRVVDAMGHLKNKNLAQLIEKKDKG